MHLADTDIHAAAALAALAVSGEGFTVARVAREGVAAARGADRPPRRCGSVTGCTPRRAAAVRRRGSRPMTCCSGSCASGSPICTSASATSATSWSAAAGRCRVRRSTNCAVPPSCTTSARRFPTPSSGPLNEDEWMFMRRHTLVGERILAAAPALARWPRSSARAASAGAAAARSVPARRSRSGRESWPCATPSTPSPPSAPYAAAEGADAAIGELRSCGGAPSSTPEAFAAALGAGPRHRGRRQPRGRRRLKPAPVSGRRGRAYQCTPRIRCASATCVEARSPGSFSPLAAAESGNTL